MGRELLAILAPTQQDLYLGFPAVLSGSVDQSGIRRHLHCERHFDRGSRVVHLVCLEDLVEYLQKEQRERTRDQDYASSRLSHQHLTMDLFLRSLDHISDYRHNYDVDEDKLHGLARRHSYAHKRLSGILPYILSGSLQQIHIRNIQQMYTAS
jgi:hypothetical protein